MPAGVLPASVQELEAKRVAAASVASTLGLKPPAAAPRASVAGAAATSSDDSVGKAGSSRGVGSSGGAFVKRSVVVPRPSLVKPVRVVASAPLAAKKVKVGASVPAPVGAGAAAREAMAKVEANRARFEATVAVRAANAAKRVASEPRDGSKLLPRRGRRASLPGRVHGSHAVPPPPPMATPTPPPLPPAYGGDEACAPPPLPPPPPPPPAATCTQSTTPVAPDMPELRPPPSQDQADASDLRQHTRSPLSPSPPPPQRQDESRAALGTVGGDVWVDSAGVSPPADSWHGEATATRHGASSPYELVSVGSAISGQDGVGTSPTSPAPAHGHSDRDRDRDTTDGHSDGGDSGLRLDTVVMADVAVSDVSSDHGSRSPGEAQRSSPVTQAALLARLAVLAGPRPSKPPPSSPRSPRANGFTFGDGVSPQREAAHQRLGAIVSTRRFGEQWLRRHRAKKQAEARRKVRMCAVPLGRGQGLG